MQYFSALLVSQEGVVSVLSQVLSVVSTQFKSILDAIREGRNTFSFPGEEVSLDSTVGVFITMNPGYLGRTELPESLKALFRPVTVRVAQPIWICSKSAPFFVLLCVFAYVNVCKCTYMCVIVLLAFVCVFERVCVCMRVFLFAYVYVKERESVCVCVCVCEGLFHMCMYYFLKGCLCFACFCAYIALREHMYVRLNIHV